MTLATTLILFGSFWFWVIVVLVNLAIILTEENDYNFWPIVILVGTIIVLQTFSNLHPLSWAVKQHPLNITVYVAVYIAIGVVWSFFKWWSYLIDQRDVIKEMYLGRGWTALSDDEKKQQQTNQARFLRNSIPTADKNKGRIIHWMTFWPWSIIATFLSDFVQKLFRFVYNQKIAERVFADILKEVSSVEEKK